jgi:SsrA-binding protein
MKIYAENKRGRFNYEITDTHEAGVMLSGAEVKSVRKGQISLKEAFGTVRGNELWLTNAHISPYKPAGNKDYDPTHTRKLLLKKSEIVKLIGAVQATGMTLVPLKIYDKNGKIKVELGVGKGKKKYDKRESIKLREQNREIERAIKNKG